MGTSILGSRVLRTEDPQLVTGEANYAEDVPVEGALHAVFVRSWSAHATFETVHTDDAASMPGVVGVFTAQDFEELPAMWLSGAISEEIGRPVMARGVVRFVGEPVAVIVAETRGQAMDAAENVFVDYEPLPPIVDPAHANDPGAPILFPGAESNTVFTFDMGHGDDSILRDADVVVRERVVAQILAPVPMEANSITVVPDGEGLTVHASSQVGHVLRDSIAEGLKLPRESVRVLSRWVGGGFGAKIDPTPEYVVVAALAHRLQRPVRWIETRSENLTSMTHGRARVGDIELGAKRDGTMTGMRVHLLADYGAYPGLDALDALLTFQMASGAYAIPRVGYLVTGVVTTTTPKAAYRGAGRPEATQFLEVAVDHLAAELGMDPAELRRKNFVAPGAFPYMTPTGAEYDSGDYGRALDRALELAGYGEVRAEQARRRAAGDGSLLGIGICSYVEVTAVGPVSEFGGVEVEPDGTVLVRAGTGPTGQGHETAFAQLAASLLDVPMESVRVVVGDTGDVRRGEGTYGSRSLQLGGSAVHKAGITVVEKARALAAHLLEAAAEDMVVQDGRVGVAGAPDRSMTWAELATTAADPARLPEGMEPGLAADGTFAQPAQTYPFGTHVSVVEVDPDTGAVTIVRHVAVDDCGRILNPMLVDGQVHGGLAQGIAQALFESFEFDEGGNPLTANLTVYEMPGPPDLPSYVVDHTQTDTPLNPLGAKGIGESATIGSTPAVQNAVLDALRPLGVHHLDLPLTPEKVWRAIRDASGHD
jgi:carbon-monoxide dehydrogenase large subunit